MARARTGQENELDELLTLYGMLNPDDPPLERDESLRTQWQEMLADDSLHTVVVEHEGQLVSSCLLSITQNLTRGARPFGLIENVVTHESYRQNGFGKQCLQKAIDIADDRDCYKIMLLTGSDKEWKHQFYERCGFDREEKTGFVLNL
jgi:GNAT superfamily N-acetyltransferase